MARRKMDEPTHQPERAIIGHCPRCQRVVIIFNNHEVWSYVRCACGWHGDTSAIANRERYERGGIVT